VTEGEPDALRAGQLLVATPVLVDPSFERTVVLLLDHDEGGSLGVVLNRPSPVPVETVLPAWSETASAPPVVFQGGPVGTDSALAVAALPVGGDPDEPVGFRRVYGRTGLVDLDAPADVLGPAVSGLRIFAGYAGWGDGQLRDEVAEGSWYVVPALPTDAFATAPGRLWRDVLRRQPGQLAWVSTLPADPTQN
jgi:putative transcriptional regulator